MAPLWGFAPHAVMTANEASATAGLILLSMLTFFTDRMFAWLDAKHRVMFLRPARHPFESLVAL